MSSAGGGGLPAGLGGGTGVCALAACVKRKSAIQVSRKEVSRKDMPHGSAARQPGETLSARPFSARESRAALSKVSAKNAVNHREKSRLFGTLASCPRAARPLHFISEKEISYA